MRIAVVAVLAFFALAGGASAAPFAVGTGDTPAVAVDSAGTAYIAWNGADAQDTPQFCRLPRGATACDVALTLPITPGTISTSRPHVSLLGGRVSVLVWRTGQAVGITQYVSTDGGASFTARVVGGNVPIHESADGPGDTVSVVTDADGRGGLFQNVPLSGGSATPIATLDAERPYYGAVGLDGANPVTVFGTALGDQVRFRRYLGTGDINVAANWSEPVEIGYATYPRLAGGPFGLTMLAGDAAGTMVLRRFTGAGFGAPVNLGPGDSSESHLAGDPAGRLHAVYPTLDAAGYHAVHVVSDNGVPGAATVLADTGFSVQPGSMRVAAAADHVGVAVWENGPQIHVSAIPVAQAPPPPPLPPPPTQPPPDPQPQFNRSVVVSPTGTVRVRLPGSSRFVALTALDDVPFGATIDARRGSVVLRAVPRRGGPVETVRLFDGMFRISQSGNVVNFTLNEPLASCGRRGSAAQKKAKSRKLWGDGKGAFRTSGKYSAATVRGTRWLVQDSCRGTLTRVTQGSVLVRDKVRGRNVIVRAGRTYTARPRR
ncbi:hypothetical protein DVA67_000870 [Solirubrobacter sp. CPCC 204708]|uniref:Exo-alpha-sialidase n=1 Tax=Solirubrobacter deserti TaxID=2282478 RepID=A0ABT4RDA4_9ACTN|nr:hypothetical protein [Solirubrobacter deserti]MBE2314510.1 hypothetical protein [Solirubrobacter deserti]MDA0136515.1 hypothetical protein [Solirubrobacter deserti]